MASPVYIRIDGLELLEKLGAKLTDATAQKACKRALEKSAKSALSGIPQDFKARYNIKTKASELKSAFYIKNPDVLDGVNMTVELGVKQSWPARGQRIYPFLSYLSDFGARVKIVRKGNRRYEGASVRILKNGSPKMLSVGGRGAFIMTPKKGGPFVAVRKRDDRLPVMKLGIKVETMFRAKREDVMERWREDALKKLQQELNFALRVEK